jgi:hypothetical protein
MSNEEHKDALSTAKKTGWQRPALKYVGHVGDIFQGGGGKLSLVADDTGDSPRKPKGQE